MKNRVISIILAVIMLLSALPISGLAGGTIPVIVVGGYTSPQLFLFNEDGSIKKKIWKPDIKGILEFALKDMPNITKTGIDLMVEKNPDLFVENLGRAVGDYAKYMSRNTDGTNKYNTGTWPKTAEQSSLKYINANKDSNEYIEGSIREARYAPLLGERIGEENVFNFSVDWRQNSILCALDLGKYIVDVLNYSGSKKVNIFCESHGGETTSTYTALCSIVAKGGENAEKLASLLGISREELSKYFNLSYLNNVVLDCPAMGVRLAYDIVVGKTHFDAPRLLSFLEYANNPLVSVTGGGEYVWESDYEWLAFFLTLDNFNDIVNQLIQTTDLIEILLSFGSIWDFMPLQYYDEVKELKLDTAEKKAAYAPMIEKSDFEHYVVMQNMNEYLTYAREQGVNVNIICGTDLTTVSGSRVNGDSLVAANDASGAKLSGYGYRFSDGYKTDYSDKAVTCKDPSHNHVSPRMNLDAAYGYLPENTWFLEEQYHAMYVTDDYCLSLVNYLLFADKQVDIYSNPEFPQYEVTYNAKMGVHAAFDKSQYGTVSKADKALVIKNLSAKSNIEIVAVKVEGMDISFEDVYGTRIPMGESVSLEFKGEIPDADMKNITVSVYYLKDSSIFSIGGRTFNYVVKGGKAIQYDSSKPICEVKEKPNFLTLSDIMSGIGNFDFVSRIKAVVISAVVVFKTISDLFKSLSQK